MSITISTPLHREMIQLPDGQVYEASRQVSKSEACDILTRVLRNKGRRQEKFVTDIARNHPAIVAWSEECCVFDKNASVAFNDLFVAFNAWVKDTDGGNEHLYAANIFAGLFLRLFPSVRRIKHGIKRDGKSLTRYSGVRLKKPD